MKAFIRHWTIFSLLLLSGCGAIERPNTDLCIINAQAHHRVCYNIRDDYTDEGKLKPDAKPKIRINLSIEDLDKALIVDSPYDEENPNPTHFEDGLARLKTWIKELREGYGI